MCTLLLTAPTQLTSDGWQKLSPRPHRSHLTIYLAGGKERSKHIPNFQEKKESENGVVSQTPHMVIRVKEPLEATSEALKSRVRQTDRPFTSGRQGTRGTKTRPPCTMRPRHRPSVAAAGEKVSTACATQQNLPRHSRVNGLSQDDRFFASSIMVVVLVVVI